MKRRTFIKDTALLVAAASTGGALRAAEKLDKQGPVGEPVEPQGPEGKLIVSPPMLQNYAETSIGVAFAVGALAPVILGAMKESMGSLSATFPILAIIWVVCSALMFIVAHTSYQKDYNKIH